MNQAKVEVKAKKDKNFSTLTSTLTCE